MIISSLKAKPNRRRTITPKAGAPREGDFVDAIVTETLKDPEIASYFFYQSGAPANGHPTADQIKSCLVFQIASATGGAETYPPAASETGGFTCRTMVDAHANLHIPNSVFFKFVTTAATVLLGLGVSNDDASTVELELGWGVTDLRGLTESGELPALVLGHRIWGGAWVLLLVAMLTSVIGASLACQNVASRMWFGMARAGALPAAVARVHPTHRTPTVAIGVNSPRAVR